MILMDSVEKPWQNLWKNMEKPWQNPWKNMEKPSMNAEKHGLYRWYLQHVVHLTEAPPQRFCSLRLGESTKPPRFCWGKGYPLVNEHRLLEIAIEMVDLPMKHTMVIFHSKLLVYQFTRVND